MSLEKNFQKESLVILIYPDGFKIQGYYIYIYI